MDTELRSLAEDFRSESPYRRIFEAYSLMFGEGKYAALDSHRRYREEPSIIDQINFSQDLFVDPLPIASLVRTIPAEPGYGTSSGELELGQLVTVFEGWRANAYIQDFPSVAGTRQEISLAGSAVAVGSGVTGSLAIAIAGAAEHERSQDGGRCKIYYSSPCYGMVEEIARTFSLLPVPFGQENGRHLPSLSDTIDSFDTEALAYVLTYPANPSLSCYTSTETDLLARLIEKCRKNDTFLIVDTIFQDMRWSGEPSPEVFSLVDGSRNVVKTFGPSKDTPFAGGLRIGYMIGDSRLRPHVDRVASAVLNSHNFYSKLWLGLDLIFRRGTPSVADFVPFRDNFILGNHGRRMSHRDIYLRVQDAGLYDNYQKAREHNLNFLNGEIIQIHEYLSQSEHFSVGPRPRFGNILLVRLKDPYAFESEYDFLFRALFEANVGLLVGGCFGVPEDSDEILFRVVVAAEDATWTIRKLQRIEAIL